VRRDWRDIAVVSERDLAAAGGEVREDLLAVWVRRGGMWHPVVLTGWRQLRPGYWAARLQTGPGEEPVWVEYKGVALQPVLPQVGDPGEAPAGAGR
jgi:hypothetical protein